MEMTIGLQVRKGEVQTALLVGVNKFHVSDEDVRLLQEAILSGKLYHASLVFTANSLDCTIVFDATPVKEEK